MTRREVVLVLSVVVTAAAALTWAGAFDPTSPPPATRTEPRVLLPALPDPIDAWLEMDADVLAGVAMGEDRRAAEAVAWVVLNRAGCEIGPDGYSCERPFLEVVLEGRAFGTWRGGTWHRSWWPGRTWRGPGAEEALLETEGRVYTVLLGFVPDPTEGATHFHRLGTWTPPWAPPARAWRVYGSHAFYRAR